MIASLYYAASDWKKSIACYSCAFMGDVVDGWVARRFNQSSVYGGILDMVTDRVSTAGFLCILSTLYPKYAFHFSMLVVLDIASHWFHVASVSLLTVGQGMLLYLLCTQIAPRVHHVLLTHAHSFF